MYPRSTPVNDGRMWFWRSHLRMIHNMNICYQEPGKNTLLYICFLCLWVSFHTLVFNANVTGFVWKPHTPSPELDLARSAVIEEWFCINHTVLALGCLQMKVPSRMMLPWIKWVARPKTAVQTLCGDLLGVPSVGQIGTGQIFQFPS